MRDAGRLCCSRARSSARRRWGSTVIAADGRALGETRCAPRRDLADVGARTRRARRTGAGGARHGALGCAHHAARSSARRVACPDPVLRGTRLGRASSGSPPGTRTRRFRRGEVDLPRRRPGRRPVRHRQRRGEDLGPVRIGRGGDPHDAPRGRRLRRAGPARRRAAIGQGRGPRRDRDGRPAARPVPRAGRHRTGHPRRAPRLAGGRAPPPDDPRRGAAFPRHDRAAGGASRPACGRIRATPIPTGRSTCGRASPRPSWPRWSAARARA